MTDSKMYIITIDGKAGDEIHLRLSSKQALYVAQRLLSQIEMNDTTDNVTAVLIIAGNVREVQD